MAQIPSFNDLFPYQILLSNLPRVTKEDIWHFLEDNYGIIPDAVKIFRKGISSEDIIARLCFEDDEPRRKLAAVLNNATWLNSVLHAELLAPQQTPNQMIDVKMEYLSDDDDSLQDSVEKNPPKNTSYNTRTRLEKEDRSRQRVNGPQKRRLLELTYKNMDVLTGKVGVSRYKPEKKLFWEKAALELNGLGGAQRTAGQWQKCFRDMGKNRKKFEGNVSANDREGVSNNSTAADDGRGSDYSGNGEEDLDDRSMTGFTSATTLNEFLLEYGIPFNSVQRCQEPVRKKTRLKTTDEDPEWLPSGETLRPKTQPPVSYSNEHPTASEGPNIVEPITVLNESTEDQGEEDTDEQENAPSIASSLHSMAESFRNMAESHRNLAHSVETFVEQFFARQKR